MYIAQALLVTYKDMVERKVARENTESFLRRTYSETYLTLCYRCKVTPKTFSQWCYIKVDTL